MNKVFAAGLLAVIIATAACDKVNGPYKKDNTGGPVDTNNVVLQKVLVEDYTGHKCGNCPRASRAIYNLKPVYGDRLIIMAVHAGTYATVFPPSAPYYTYDFRNSVSTTLDTDFGISVVGNPNGMVNRKAINGNHIITSTQWGDETANILSSTTPAAVKLSIETNYNAATRLLNADVTTEFKQTLTGNYKLCVYMLEDSIVNWQKDYDVSPEDVPDYVHREVLRGSMNGTYGDVIAVTTSGTISNLNFNYTLDSGWNENHFSLVAFLYDDATKEIIQVEQKHL